MKYKYSKLDKDNLKWFANDMSKATLTEIDIRIGNLRGLHHCHLQFNYPISVIAGKNGSGKSTILALAACAFHNTKKGFRLPGRRTSYYTFSDFFIQTSEEVPPEGIKIWYRFRHDNWRKTKRNPNGTGNLYQTREKKNGGKWNNYSGRVNRNIVFLGIQRVVPHSEKSVSRSYRTYFKVDVPDGWEEDVKKVVGRILGTKYDAYWLKTHSKYRLPLVESKGNIYSGVCLGFFCGIGSCGEYQAIGSMISNGEKEIKTIVAVLYDEKTKKYGIIPPCGKCREMIWQTSKKNQNTEVIISKSKKVKLKELLPNAWGGSIEK